MCSLISGEKAGDAKAKFVTAHIVVFILVSNKQLHYSA